MKSGVELQKEENQTHNLADIRLEVPVGCCNRSEFRFKFRFKNVGRAEI